MIRSRFTLLSLVLVTFGLGATLPAAARTPKIALYDDEGSGGKGIPSVQSILSAPKFDVTALSAEDIRSGKLAGYDAVIFTGGSGSKQAETLQATGVDEVRKFVEAGGGYLGICAGAYLACDGFSWSAKMLNAKTVSQKWRRGHGDVQIELTPEGKEILGDFTGLLPVRYANGPIIKPANSEGLPDYKPLAFFRTELAENDTPVGVMVNAPAIVAATFGKGKLITMSPHPEQTPALNDMIVHAAQWITKPAEVAQGSK
ncbi:BPL-N domain-containing protein [soil metagenome]